MPNPQQNNIQNEIEQIKKEKNLLQDRLEWNWVNQKQEKFIAGQTRMKLSKSKTRKIYGRTDLRKTKKVRINFKIG